MYCIRCGKEINDNSQFCAFCGNPIGTNNTIVNNITIQTQKKKYKKISDVPPTIAFIISMILIPFAYLGAVFPWIHITIYNYGVKSTCNINLLSWILGSYKKRFVVPESYSDRLHDVTFAYYWIIFLAALGYIFLLIYFIHNTIYQRHTLYTHALALICFICTIIAVIILRSSLYPPAEKFDEIFQIRVSPGFGNYIAIFFAFFSQFIAGIDYHIRKNIYKESRKNRINKTKQNVQS